MTATADTLDAVLGNAPELRTAPGLAVAAASSPDPVSAGQTLAHTANGYATDTATEQVGAKVGHADLLHQTLGFLHAPLAAVEHAGSIALHLANAGLQEVQHQYRTLHDIEARHGPVVGLLEALGLAAAGTAGVLLAPEALAIGAGTAAVFGAEAATGIAARTVFRDSWARTEHGNAYQGIYDRQTGAYSGGPVSLGRDFADHLPHPLRFISGVTDGLADLTLDPLANVGKGFAASREARLSVNTVADLDHALTSPLTSGAISRAFERIAAEPSAAKIALQYPKFEGVASDLAAASNPGDVEQFFRDTLSTAEHISRLPGTIPNLPITRVPGAAVRDFVRSYNGPGQAMLRVFQLLPTSFDEETLRFSNKDFNPSGTSWKNGVYRALRYGQSDTVARNVVDAMAATDNLGLRRDIYVNGIHSMLVNGLGLADDNRFVRNIMQTLEDTTPNVGGAENVYAATADGRNLSVLPATENTTARAAAVFESQTGRWAFPDYHEVLRARRAHNAITDLMGAADDAFYQHFTQAIFKRAALLTGGFAFRIAAAEAIPAGFREGFTNLIRSSVQAHVGNLGPNGDEEIGHVAAAVNRLIGGVTKSSLAKNAEDVNLATRTVVANGGHVVPPALLAGGGEANYLDGAAEEKANRLAKMFKSVPPEKRLGNDFGIFGAGPDHTDAWHAALKEASRSELGQTAAVSLRDGLAAGKTLDAATRDAQDAVKTLLDGKDAKWLGQFERHFTSSTPGIAPHEDWAKVVVDSLKGVAGHPYDPNFVHTDILDHLANGETPPKALLDAVPAAEQPMVKGRIEMPNMPASASARIANAGYSKVLDPIINFLSREPIYFNELKTQYEPLKALVNAGVLNEDDALRIAQVRAVNGVVPFIHNPLERSQFAELARNFMPFYFAQTQSYRRVGRLLADDPGAFRKYVLATTALHDVGHTVDDNGQQTFVMPGAGFLGQGAAKALGALGFGVAGSIPVAFTGNVQSLNTVLPFAEDSGGLGAGPITARFGPLVAIPMHAIETLFPEVGIPVANKVLGPTGASGGFVDQFIPNTPLRNALKAVGWVGGGRDLQNAMVQTLQALDYRQQAALRKWEAGGEQGPRPDIVPDAGASPDVKQQFVNRVKNQSRILLLTKAAISLFSPTSPKLEAGDLGLHQELSDLMSSKGADGKPLGLGAAVDTFLAKHPDATAYTVFGSKNLSGADLPANHPAQAWLDANLGLLHKYPAAAAWLIPQSADRFSQAVYNEQLAMGLRVKKAPEQVQNDIYIAMGNQQFYDHDLPAYQQALAAAGSDKAAVNQIRANWSAYLKNVLGAQNPIWFDDFESQTRQHERDRAIGQLDAMFSKGDAPAGAQTDAVHSLLADFHTYQATVVAGRQDSWSAQQRDAAHNNWLAYLDNLAVEKPMLAPIIQKLFRSA